MPAVSTPAAHKPNAPKKVARAAYKIGDTSEVEVDHLGEKHTLRVLHHVARLHGGSDTALQLSSVLSLSGCASRAMRSPAKYLTETLFKGAQPPELVTLKIGGLGGRPIDFVFLEGALAIIGQNLGADALIALGRKLAEVVLPKYCLSYSPLG